MSAEFLSIVSCPLSVDSMRVDAIAPYASRSRVCEPAQLAGLPYLWCSNSSIVYSVI